MNERIKELARKAGISILYEYDGYDGHAGVANFDDIEKFAELIVKECIGCCEQVISDTVPKSIDTFEQGGIHCMDEIKQHFGVEEPPVDNVDRILRTVRTRGTKE
jgi:hypothetical protein